MRVRLSMWGELLSNASTSYLRDFSLHSLKSPTEILKSFSFSRFTLPNRLLQPPSLVSFWLPTSILREFRLILLLILLKLWSPSSYNLHPSPIFTLNSLRLGLLLSISQPPSLTSFWVDMIHSTFSSSFKLLKVSEISLIPLAKGISSGCLVVFLFLLSILLAGSFLFIGVFPWRLLS